MTYVRLKQTLKVTNKDERSEYSGIQKNGFRTLLFLQFIPIRKNLNPQILLIHFLLSSKYYNTHEDLERDLQVKKQG